MKWEGQRESDNVEDVRGMGGGRRVGLPGGGRGVGLGTVAVALLAGWMFGVNPLTVLGILSGSGGEAPVAVEERQAPREAASADPQLRFLKVVLADTEDVWRAQFQANGSTYREPKLRVFRGQTETACGAGEAAMGPFYCPGDQDVYIDLAFNETLSRQLGAPGDFAQAYVVAHEVGHHVQNLLGISDKVDAMRNRVGRSQQNALSVRLELQADCLAGVWAHHSQRSKGWLEQGDIEEALNAATRIGDDTLQRQAQGRIVPESFTHGTSAQRVRWFQRGLTGGQMSQCDTFGATSL